MNTNDKLPPQETAGEAVSEFDSMIGDVTNDSARPNFTPPAPTDNTALVEALRIPAPRGSSNLHPHQQGYNEALDDVLTALASRPAEAK